MRNFIKRFLDILLAFLGLIILLPVMAIVAIMIRMLMGKGILFKQARAGYNGNIFYIYKFRTMLNITDEQGNFLSDECRMTKFGKILRATSLDELPELINVLKGEMSIVGPRPLLAEYLNYYTLEQNRRHCVKPGITGWAQINGRNSITWAEKFDLDLWYIDHHSIVLDLKIIVLTILKTLKREGINEEGHVTASPFFPDNKKVQ